MAGAVADVRVEVLGANGTLLRQKVGPTPPRSP
jgi:hypothetical protein